MTIADKAYLWAKNAHEGQFRKNGWEPYINHPVRVASRVKHLGEVYEVVALLHDTVEDTPLTLDDIRFEFGDEVTKAVDSVSRREGEKYNDFVRRSYVNKIGRQVKIADLQDNSDPSQLAVYTEDEKKFKIKRYTKALEMLENCPCAPGTILCPH